MVALKIYRYYLYGVHIDVFTNPKSLQYVFTQKQLNLFQKRWLELLKDYDISVLYHPKNANVVAHALSRMTMGSVSHIEEAKKDLAKEIHSWLGWGEVGGSPNGGAIVHNNSNHL